MLKICNDFSKDVEISETTFEIDETLFSRMLEYVQKNKIKEGTCFSIINKRGKHLFYIIYLEDLIAGIKRKDLSDYAVRFRDDVQNMDFTLLDRYRKFVFLEVEDYSVAIARLISKYRPEKKVIFTDKRAKHFLGNRVKYLHFPYDVGKIMGLTEEWLRGNGGNFGNRLKAFLCWKLLKCLRASGNCCIVKADRRNHPGGEGIAYNSQNIVYSLLWKKRERSFGEENPDKKIVVLDYACDDEGIGSITMCAFAHVMWMRDRGYIPVMNLHTYPNQYLNSTNENMWEYFFEPVSSVTVNDAYRSKYVIAAPENDISWCDFHINPYQREYMESCVAQTDFKKIVRINGETKEHIDAKMPKEIREGKRILGVVARGTDYREEAAVKTNKSWRINVVKIDAFIEACDYYKKKLDCDYIFVATEDKEYFERFRERFGEDLLFISQKRVIYNYTDLKFKPVKELLAVKDGKKAGRDYLAIIQSLTECSALLYNVECGAVRLAKLWKRDKYELFQYIAPNWNGI